MKKLTNTETKDFVVALVILNGLSRARIKARKVS